MKLFLILFTLQFSFAQEICASSTTKGLSEIDFQRAKSLYLNMSRSETYKESSNASRDFVNHMPTENDEWLTLQGNDFIKWVTENLALTKFKTLEEATALDKKCFDLKKKLMEENHEVFKLIKQATFNQLKEIVKPDTERRW